MIVSAPLDLDQFVDEELSIEFEVFSYFYSHGYPVESIEEAYSVVNQKPEDADTGHIVVKIETLSKPIDEADVAVDTCTLFACDCKGYQHHYKTNLEENRITDWGVCPHIESVDKVAKAKNDDNQTKL